MMIQAILGVVVGVAGVLICQEMIQTDDASLLRNIRRTIRANADRDTGRVDPPEAYDVLCRIQDKVENWRG